MEIGLNIHDPKNITHTFHSLAKILYKIQDIITSREHLCNSETETPLCNNKTIINLIKSLISQRSIAL